MKSPDITPLAMKNPCLSQESRRYRCPGLGIQHALLWHDQLVGLQGATATRLHPRQVRFRDVS